MGNHEELQKVAKTMLSGNRNPRLEGDKPKSPGSILAKDEKAYDLFPDQVEPLKHSLSELSKEYLLFTLKDVYRKTGLSKSITAEFNMKANQRLIKTYECNRKLFGDQVLDDWDHMIQAIPKEHEKDFMSFILSAKFIDSTKPWVHLVTDAHSVKIDDADITVFDVVNSIGGIEDEN